MQKIHCILLTCLIISLLISGCIETNFSDLLYVDDDFDKFTQGWNKDHFSSIQNAIDHANSNCTIYVNEGIYQENIVIDQPSYVRIIGSNPNETIISGNKNGQHGLFIDEQAQVNISGFMIMDCNQGPELTGTTAGLYVTSNHNSFHSLILKNNSNGIYTLDSSWNQIYDNAFVNNYYGILLYTYSTNNSIHHNLFLSNNIGCRVKGSNQNILYQNLFSENRGGTYVCCVSNDNQFYLNIYSNNSDFHAQDWCLNTWNATGYGNYWSDFYQLTPGAVDQNNDGIVDMPFTISRGYQPEEYPNKDYFPLVNRPLIKNSFTSQYDTSMQN